MPGNSRAEALKAEGNKFFKSGDYTSAIAKYNAATEIDPNVPAYWSNMAACFEKISEYDQLISDCLLIARIETTRPNRHCDDRALTCHDERVLYESTSSVGVLDYGLPERANQQKDTSI